MNASGRRIAMQYEPLEKVYWKNPEPSTVHQQEYRRRYNSPFTEHIRIDIKQHNRKRSFPAFFCYTNECAMLLEQILIEHQKLQTIIDKLPKIVLDQFFLLCILDEVKSSNDIEGIRSTRKELRETISNPTARSRFQSTVAKYAMLLGHEKIQLDSSNDLRKFYEEFAYQEVLEADANNRLDGTIFRKDDVDIEQTIGKTIHRGVHPEAKIIDYVDTMLSFAHNDNVPIIIRTAICHYLLAYIHPFYDGNGRTARVLSSYALKQILHQSVAMRLSVCIRKNKERYYRLLGDTDCEHNCGDLTPFVIGFMEIIVQSIKDSCRLLNRKLEQFRKNMALIDRLSDDPLTLDMYKALFQSSLLFGQGLCMDDLSRYLGKSKNTIYSRLKALPEDHVLATRLNRQIFYRFNLLILRDLNKA